MERRGVPAPSEERLSDELPPVVITTDGISDFVYAELKRIARHHLRATNASTAFSTTELVHEAFLKLRPPATFEGQAHFFGSAARAMRQVLVDFARHLHAEKRGGAYRRVSLSDADGAIDVQLDEMLALDAALDRLGAVDPRLMQLVELRFFGGLQEREIAAILGVTTRTVARSWLKARLFLLQALEPGA